MIRDLFSQMPFFSSLPVGEIEYLVSTLAACEMPPGAIVFQEGHSDDRCYILLKGQVEIIKALHTPDERLLGVRQAGMLLGEMSLFSEDGQHTASVRAGSPLTMLAMTRADFEALLHRRPEMAFELIRQFSNRLEQSENLTILDLQEKNRQLTQAYQELQAAQAQIIEKEKLEHELEIAREIQLSILPHELPHFPRFDFGALMIPARAVGGDFYEFIPLDEDRLAIAVGDVSDKGVPAALFMALTYSLIQAEAEKTASPAETLRRVNHHLLEINASDMFVTLLYGVLDCATGELQYARAGHPPPIILDERNQIIEIPTRLGQPLGLFEDFKLDEQSLTLPAGGTAIFFSDGLNETVNDQGDDYGLERLAEALSLARGASAQMVCDRLWQSVKTFSGDLPQHDDFTIVTIKSHS